MDYLNFSVKVSTVISNCSYAMSWLCYDVCYDLDEDFPNMPYIN